MRRTLSIVLGFALVAAVLIAQPFLLASEDPPAAESDNAAKELPKAAEGTIDYAKQVKPILAKHCYDCHGAEMQESGLRLHAKAMAMAGGDNGAAIKPSDAAGSSLLARVAGIGDGARMPPEDSGDALSAEEVGVLRAWIEQGAKWPDGADGDVKLAGQDHWAYQPPKAHVPPDVRDVNWSRTAVDRFILARLDKEGLKPSAEFDRPRLLRRVALDITGIPPSVEDVDAFVADERPDAYEQAVDRLLASPKYGERWAAMWLDLARYADTQGYEKDNRRTIWRYRDWVIDAFNRNLPFDQFTIEQLAGDLLPNATPEQVLATAFHRNTMTNTEGGTDNEEFRVAAVVDRVNTTWAVWMATTFACCQCHSHKYDPFTQREYYQFLAFLNQTEDQDNDDESPVAAMPSFAQQHETARLERSLASIDAKIAAMAPELTAEANAWAARLQGEVAWQQVSPSAIKSSNGAMLTLQADGSILASGNRPENDTYTLDADGDWAGITAIRLEVLPDASLPNQGSGRADDGNFVLSRISATVQPRDGAPRQGRFVRIELPGKTRILSLAEVEVFAAEQNVAAAGKARQSTTAYEGVAQRAIDGNTNGAYEAGSTTHSAHEDNPWWEVDLGAMKAIDRVVVWNRLGAELYQRLNGCRVSLLDEARKVVWETAVAEAPQKNAALSISGEQPINLTTATADFSQGEFSVAEALASKNLRKNGWAVQPHVKSAHEAVFALASPVVGDAGTLRVVLEQQYERPHFTLGRFRLSVTRDATVLEKHALPAEVRAALAVPREKQGDAERVAILAYYRTIAPHTKALRDEKAAFNKQIAEIQPPQIPVLRALPASKQRATKIMNRGNFLDLGDVVSPGVPATTHAMTKELPADRLGMARWMASGENPLFGRVLVNRLWERLFGIGIVETTEDFGTQGALPSHPELLDWLAADAARQDWDVKGVLRRMVTSSVYRQTSQVTPELLEKDAYNRLLARGPRVRLSAEVVRDQALAISGLLSHKLHGASVMPPQPEGVWKVVYSGDNWATSPGEDRYRRGVYTFWRRTSPHPAMVAFDAPSREFCVLRRPKSNTPLQALVTLNDPAYIEAAQVLARRIVREGGASTRERVAYAIKLCVCRAASEQEISRIAALLESERKHFAEDAAAAKKMAESHAGPTPHGMDAGELAAWTVVANVLLNLDEVITKG
jgi:hypothetical protein